MTPHLRHANEEDMPAVHAIRDAYLSSMAIQYASEPAHGAWAIAEEPSGITACMMVVKVNAGMIVHGIYGIVGPAGKRGVGALIHSLPPGTASVVPVSNEPLLGAITKRGWVITSVIVERVA